MRGSYYFLGVPSATVGMTDQSQPPKPYCPLKYCPAFARSGGACGRIGAVNVIGVDPESPDSWMISVISRVIGVDVGAGVDEEVEFAVLVGVPNQPAGIGSFNISKLLPSMLLFAWFATSFA
jgi:hypothetical protein